jgi:hypothetical protein
LFLRDFGGFPKGGVTYDVYNNTHNTHSEKIRLIKLLKKTRGSCQLLKFEERKEKTKIFMKEKDISNCFKFVFKLNSINCFEVLRKERENEK